MNPTGTDTSPADLEWVAPSIENPLPSLFARRITHRLSCTDGTQEVTLDCGHSFVYIIPSPTRNAMLLAPSASMTTRSNTARQHTLNHDPRTSKATLDELREEGLIGYAISPHRPGEHGPHLEVWKGPSFHDPVLRSEALFSVSDPARALFHQLVSSESQGLDQVEPTAE